MSDEHRREQLYECANYFIESLERARQRSPEERSDLHARPWRKHAEHGPRWNILGNLILLIVGGNDTTRNTISGSVLALNENPDQYKKLRENPDLIPNMVSETIRWQTPLAHMRRNAKRDIEFRRQRIKKGEKVIMWYVSGNRDEEVIENPNAYIIDRARRAASIYPSASASTVAWATAWRNCSSRSSGKRL